MVFRTLALAAVTLTCAAGIASAQVPLTPAQMDGISAGAALPLPNPTPVPAVVCPTCTIAYSNSMSNNGVTTSTSGSQTPGAGGSSGGSGGSGGTTGGGGTGPTSPILTPVSVPPALAAILTQAGTATPTTP